MREGISELLITVSIWCYLEKEGSRIGVTLVLGRGGRKAFQFVLSSSGEGCELVWATCVQASSSLTTAGLEGRPGTKEGKEGPTSQSQSWCPRLPAVTCQAFLDDGTYGSR